MINIDAIPSARVGEVVKALATTTGESSCLAVRQEFCGPVLGRAVVTASELRALRLADPAWGWTFPCWEVST